MITAPPTAQPDDPLDDLVALVAGWVIDDYLAELADAEARISHCGSASPTGAQYFLEVVR